MRISDWSSDVCSSDLILDILVEAARACEDTEQEGRQRMKRSGANSALRNFLGSEAAGGVLLMLTAALAMIVANINEDLYRVYHDLLHAPIAPTLSSKLGPMSQIGRAHVLTPGTNAHLVCRLLLEQKHNKLNI